ncbi:MAG: hypothetical protein DWQ07_20885 [Chloroflexi bacterium]|nr:MAG: hypothetical protein DWQ07_20885 [Chloroflexota bacterium]MBL1194541.1 hypothetical protein [Chloroflexota bacterium]NOH11829.1 hypothetical protein [Chloroflexota bacterium]
MKPSHSLMQFLRTGLYAGLVAAVLNILIYLVITSIGGYGWAAVILVSILVASLLPNLLAALAYFGLSYVTSKARLLLAIGVTVFVLISVLPHLGIGPAPSPALSMLPEGFDIITVPLHIVFGLTAIFVMPWLLARSSPSIVEE